MHIISSSRKTHYPRSEINIISSSQINTINPSPQINTICPFHRYTQCIIFSDRHTISSFQIYTYLLSDKHTISTSQKLTLYILLRNAHYILFSDKHTISSSQKYTYPLSDKHTISTSQKYTLNL